MEHTPGPWGVCGANDGKCHCGMIWSEDGHYPVATVTIGEWGDDIPVLKIEGTPGSCEGELTIKATMDRIAYGTVPEELAFANARIIATAPKLLAACEVYLKAMATVVPISVEEICDTLNEITKQIMAAVDEAKGA